MSDKPTTPSEPSAEAMQAAAQIRQTAYAFNPDVQMTEPLARIIDAAFAQLRAQLEQQREDEERTLNALRRTTDMLQAIASDIEDGGSFADLRGKYVIALVDARDAGREALRAARKQEEAGT